MDGHNQQVWATGLWPYDFGYTAGRPPEYRLRHREKWVGLYIVPRCGPGGTEKAISQRGIKRLGGMDCPGRTRANVVAEDPATGLFQLWQLSGDGAERRVTNDVNDY